MTIDTGINPLGSPIVDASATNKSSASPLEAGAGSNAAVMNGLLSPSWHVYWDAENEVYKINNPIVILPGGSQMAATVPKLEDGEWVCKITKTDETYTAEVVNTAAPAPTAETEGEEGDEETPVVVAQVPICTISDDAVVQKHIGTIVIVGGGNPDKTLTIDGEEIGKICADRDIEIEHKGDFEVEVITGISMAVLNGNLVMTLRKAKLQFAKGENVQNQEVKLALSNTKVVTGVTYDTSTHKLSQNVSNIKVLGITSGGPELITTATAHSKE